MKLIGKLALTQLAVALMIFQVSAQELSVTVKNVTSIERANETVEIPLTAVQAKFGDGALSKMEVFNAAGKVVASQLTRTGLIFQATVSSKSSTAYTVKLSDNKGEYKQLAFGRLVPERKDDWSWENNRIAFRVYGPALQATGEISNGMDVWLKRTPEMVINKWYKNNINYHEDSGEGLDCYKVGRTLGAGVLAPIVDGKFCLGENFVKAELIDDGAIRTTVRLSYAPQKIGDLTVLEERIISLDANSNFNTITQKFTGPFKELEVGAGIVLREGGEIERYPQAVAYTEPSDPNNGTTYLAVVMPNKCANAEIENHIVLESKVKSGVALTYQNGAGWSKFGYPTSVDWNNEVQNQVIKFNNPLKVIVK